MNSDEEQLLRRTLKMLVVGLVVLAVVALSAAALLIAFLVLEKAQSGDQVIGWFLAFVTVAGAFECKKQWNRVRRVRGILRSSLKRVIVTTVISRRAVLSTTASRRYLELLGEGELLVESYGLVLRNVRSVDDIPVASTVEVHLAGTPPLFLAIELKHPVPATPQAASTSRT